MAKLLTKIKLYANKEVNFKTDVLLRNDSDGNGVYIYEWNLDIPKPTETQLNALEAQANEIERINIVKENRAKEYPSIQEQLDLQYWDKLNNTTKWEEAINAVKIKFPK
jgi:hypothetical protein